MEAAILRTAPWQIPYRAVNVLCSDGKRRSVRITGQADTWFSLPGSVKVKGKTVSGFVTGVTDTGKDLQFIAYRYRKNAAMLP